MKPAEALGMAPTYTVVPDGDDYIVRVKPWVGLGDIPEGRVRLTERQHAQFLKWRDGQGMIQDMLPDLSADDRELLLTGMDFERDLRIREDDEEDEE